MIEPVLSERLFRGSASLVGYQPRGSAAADLDDDGYLDLVTANYGSPGPSVLFGRPDGGFLPEIRLAGTLAGSVAAVITDLDSDGIEDLIFGGAQTVRVYMGNGDRTFADEVVYPTWFASYPPFIAVASEDFNSDGHSDVVVGADNIAIHFGLGDGTLTPPELLEAGGGTHFIVDGDYNNDGCPDFVADTSDGSAFRFWGGDCDGAFDPRAPVTPGGFGAVAGDFNGDAWLDLATVHNDDLCVHFGRGTGTFDPAVCYVTGVAEARKIVSEDLNDDGHLDLVVSPMFEPVVGVLLSNGDGAFEPFLRYASPVIGGFIVSGDYDADGRMDVAIPSFVPGVGSDPDSTAAPAPLGRGMVGLMFGDGQGGLTDERPDRFEVGESPIVVAVADFDGDGLEDLATPNSESNDVSIMVGNGSGQFTEVARPSVGITPALIAAGVLDGDGTVDLLVANEGSADISVLLGNGDGTFLPAHAVLSDAMPAMMTLADLDGDGVLDLAAANPQAGTVAIYGGFGDGSFAPAVALPVGDEPRALVVADLDGGGVLDLAVVNHGSADVSVLLGSSEGAFGVETRYEAGIDGPELIVTADFDRDGSPDLAVAGTSESTALVVLNGNGRGGFAPPVSHGVSRPVQKLVAADLDGDGWVDLITGHNLPVISVLLGGETGFAPALGFAAESRGGLAVGEFNRDGLPDLVAGFTLLDQVSVLLNQLSVQIGFDSDRTLTWRRLVGYERFNTYRGNLADLQGTAPAWGVCRNAFDPELTDNTLVDAEVPAEGAGFFYLMARVRDGVESDLGTASNGQPRIPAVPCE